jgi:hypothetical protein
MKPISYPPIYYANTSDTIGIFTKFNKTPTTLIKIKIELFFMLLNLNIDKL